MRQAPTLHRLLWGPTLELDLDQWRLRPWEIPAVGLPARVATLLYVAVQRSELPADWTPLQGPLTWKIGSAYQLLSAGRRSQFGLEEERPGAIESVSAQELALGRTTEWELWPHEAYFLPFVGAEDEDDVDRDGYALYCDVLTLLTAMDGGEAILDGLSQRGLGTVPFVDRWAWRSRIHLPMEAWQEIENVLRWSEAPHEDTTSTKETLNEALGPSHCKLTSDDFLRERVDISLDGELDAEVVRTVRLPDSVDEPLPQELLLNKSRLKDELLVRIGQIQRWPEGTSVASSFPAVDSDPASHILEQVAAAFHSPNHVSHGSAPDLVLLPEVSIPQTEVRTVRELTTQTGIASLSGLYWRTLPPVYGANRNPAARRWFVNEAELAVPIGHGDRGPTGVRWYRVRKPVPAHIETGLAQQLTNSRGTHWKILRGQRWYRFLHPRWGDFTVAVCADLLDTAPWRSLRGELLHLFMVAFNRDVDLYDSLTWVRAYENYVNLVAVNHGRFGGSFLWTPRRSHGHELARLRGEQLFLIADVKVPVKGLIRAQAKGVRHAVKAAARSWKGEKPTRSEFKAPPPGFERRALLSRRKR